MYIKLLFKIILSCLGGYIFLTKGHSYTGDNEVSTGISRLIFVVLVFLLWVYMLIANFVYSIFMIYMPYSIQYISLAIRRCLYFAITTFIILILHIGQLTIFFAIRGDNVVTSGYLMGGFIWFVGGLFAYLLLLYLRPQWSVINMMIWHLFKGALQIGQRNHQAEGEQAKRSQIDDSEEANVFMMASESAVSYGAEYCDNADPYQDKRIQVYHILLFYFSKKNASYLIDTKGRKWFCILTSNDIKRLYTKEWFVKVNQNVYLNMWFFELSPYSNCALILDQAIARKLTIEMINSLLLSIKVSIRCRINVRVHFEKRTNLDNRGWDQYLYYG